MRLPFFQLLQAETLGNREIAMQLTPTPSFLLEMSFLPTSPSPKQRNHHAGEEDTEDHRQEQKCISEKQPQRKRPEQYDDDENDENDEEANPFPKCGASTFPPFLCSDRMFRVGGAGRSSRGIPGIPYMPQSPYRHQTHNASPPSASRLPKNRGKLAPEKEHAERDAQEVGGGSPRRAGIRHEASKKQEAEDSDSSPVRRNLPPRKKQKHGVSEDGTGLYFSTSPRSESPHCRNFASEHGEGRHPTIDSTTATGKRIFRGTDGEDLQSEEDHKNSLSASSFSVPGGGRGVFNSSQLGSDLPHFVGLSAPTIALPNIALLTVPNATLQPPSSILGLGSVVPAVAGLAGYLQSATPVAATLPFRSGTVAPDAPLLMTSSNPFGVASTPAAVAAAYQQLLATRDQVRSAPAYGRETSWIHSVTGLSQLATDVTANNQIPLQQQLQGITGTTSPGCTNTGPSIPCRPHANARPLPATTGDLGAPTGAPAHRLDDEHCISIASAATGLPLPLGTRTIAPSLDPTATSISAQRPWHQAHIRLTQSGAGKSTASSPTKEQIPGDGSRDDPDVHDYLVGQGGHGVHHIGNKRVRDLIHSLMPQFHAASRQQSSSTPPLESARSKLISAVIQDVHDRGGTFLQRDSTAGKWVPLPDREIVRKISQRFNEEACGRAQQQKEKKSNKTS